MKNSIVILIQIMLNYVNFGGSMDMFTMLVLPKLWTQDIFPFICVLFNFLSHCFKFIPSVEFCHFKEWRDAGKMKLSFFLGLFLSLYDYSFLIGLMSSYSYFN